MNRDSHKPGLLIVFEGIDGTGKSTQIRLLAEYLTQLDFPVVTTREPTDGPLGKQIRELYSRRDQVSREKELELFINDRRWHVDQLINPALAENKIVLCDRYYYSTAAYQGAAGCNPEDIFRKNSFAPRPDLVLLLVVPPKIGIHRIQKIRGESLNDFEQEEQLEKVASFFDGFADDCIRRIDGTEGIDDVQAEIRREVDTLLRTRYVSVK